MFVCARQPHPHNRVQWSAAEHSAGDRSERRAERQRQQRSRLEPTDDRCSATVHSQQLDTDTQRTAILLLTLAALTDDDERGLRLAD